MSEHGGRRQGAGRKKGSQNKRTIEQVQAVEESGLTPLEYLLDVMRSPIPPELEDAVKNGDVEPELIAALSGWHHKRMDAAKAAAPYVHPKLSSSEVKASIGLSHEEALDELEGEEYPLDSEE